MSLILTGDPLGNREIVPQTGGFPGGSSGEELICQCMRCKRPGFNPSVGKVLWRRTWQPSPVFLPEESHGQRSLGGCSRCIHAKLLQSCLPLYNTMFCSPPVFSVCGILQPGILEGLLRPPPRDLPNPGIEPLSPASPMLAGRFFTTRVTWQIHEVTKNRT